MKFSLLSILALATTSSLAAPATTTANEDSNNSAAAALDARQTVRWSWTPYAGSSCSGSGTGAWVQGYSSSPCYNVATVSRVKIFTDSCYLTAYVGASCPSREIGTTYGYGTNGCFGGVAYNSFKVNCV